MANIERMTVTFPAPMAAKIRAAVEQGDYASTSEVVRAAIRHYFEQPAFREFTTAEIAMIRTAWDEGKASGLVEEIDFDDIMAEARTEFDAEKLQ